MPKRVKPETHMAQKLRYNARARRLAYNVNMRWSMGDKLRVITHDKPDSVLAVELDRSIQAIQAVRNRSQRKAGIYV